jgi:mono/diheme cytochrome c family protein
MRRASLVVFTCLAVLALGEPDAQAIRRRGDVVFELETRPVGPIAPQTRGPHAGSHGSTVVADAHGLLVAERTVGAVIRAGRDGAAKGRVELRPGLGEIVGDGKGLVFVADRAADRVVKLNPGDAAGQGLEVVAEARIAEPHGLALTPDGATLLVTSVANQELVAVDVQGLSIRWRVALAPEPRGVAVTSDGKQAVVGFLSSGALAVVDLASAGTKLRWQPLNPRDQVDVIEGETFDEDDRGELRAEIREARSRFQVPTSTGRRHARVVYAVGVVAGDRIVAPHQLATPQLVRQPDAEQQDSYGGAESIPPLVHRVAFVGRPEALRSEAMFARIDVHQPRALAYDHARDTLYVGGYGDDRVLAIGGASQQAPRAAWAFVQGLPRGQQCGIDGLVVDGDRLWAHCDLTRRLMAIDRAPASERPRAEAWTIGPELAPNPRPALVARGAELFRRGGEFRLSGGGVLACASCHPEGRADGLSWRLGPSILQTPMLAGRVVGTAPFKWDGQDRDLATSLQHTIERLGGHPKFLESRDLPALRAFLESLPRPRARTDGDAAAITRGRALFAGESLGCAGCHTGAALSDGAQYPFKGSLATTDTPSLIGLGHSAPYYHDGSALSLWDIVRDKGNIHDMIDPAALKRLSPADASDLVAYLRSL